MGDNEWDTLGANTGLLDLAELVSGFLWSDTVDGEATLNVVKETEVLARLLKRNDICPTS